MTNQKDYTVIYVMGRGHSGSTVLDLILGNHNAIQSVGELASGFGFRFGMDKCACGSSVTECDFWGEILPKIKEKYPEVDLKAYSKLMNYMVRFYRIPQLKTGVGLPGWVTQIFDPMTADLYALIAQQSGKKYIVDSSKDMGYGYYLLKRLPAKVKIIHLVRDGRGVMWSRLRRLKKGLHYQFQRRYIESERHGLLMLLTVLAWNFANFVSLVLKLGHKDQILQVRYEDLCEKPEQVLRRIGEFIDLDMEDLAKRVIDSESLSTGHIICGNPMRENKQGSFTFKPDNTWRISLPVKYKLLFILLSLPLAVYFGYI